MLELNILCSQPTKIFQMQVPTVDGVGCLAKYPKKKFGYHEISCIFVLINY